MKKFVSALSLACALVTFPIVASAHQSRTYQIGTAQYLFTVGSLGEPVVVDDKSGLDLTILRNGQPFVGAEKLLKVEIASADVSTTTNLSTVWGSDGKYKTTTYFTTSDQFSYRIFGMLEGKDINVTFTCSTMGHHMQASGDTTRTQISPGVVQTTDSGSFGCPMTKSALQLPQTPGDTVGMTGRIDSFRAEQLVFDVVAILALGLAVAPYLRRRQLSMPANLAPAFAKSGFLFTIGGLVVGLGLGYAFFKTPATAPMSHSGHDMSMQSTMDGMMMGLEGKAGDEFDHAFLDEMIVHHQGAVDMARELIAKTKRPELKAFGQSIIDAQTKEIEQMKTWRAAWFNE